MVTNQPFGTGEEIRLFRITNSQGNYVELTNWGASWVSGFNTLLGYRTAQEYINDPYYMGAVIGRFANRIAGASYSINGIRYLLEANDGANSNHGGASGFSKKSWEWEVLPCGVRFTLFSPHGEGGCPGNVTVKVTYVFTDQNELCINYFGTTDAPTYLNLTNHAYFNLSGREENIAEHQLQVYSNRMLDTTDQYIPTSAIVHVENTPFDFTTLRPIGDTLYADNRQLKQNKGYNHCYVLKTEPSSTMQRAARLYHPASGRELIVETDLPGILIYTAGYYKNPDTAVCLETQFFPDTPSHPHFPSCLLLPGQEYNYNTRFCYAI